MKTKFRNLLIIKKEGEIMYLKRKIDKWLKKWKDNKNHLPALIVGVRQCGKTKSIKEFGKNNYKSYVYINFWK